MATYSCSVMTEQPRRVHAGGNWVHGQINLGASASSAGDILFLAKIPNGAVITDVRVDHSTGATAQGVSYGLANGGTAGGVSTLSAFIASGAQATNLYAAAGALPYRISCSDNDTLQYGIFAAKVESGTSTTSLIVNFRVGYQVDQLP
jgi:hypothetical protein